MDCGLVSIVSTVLYLYLYLVLLVMYVYTVRHIVRTVCWYCLYGAATETVS